MSKELYYDLINKINMKFREMYNDGDDDDFTEGILTGMTLAKVIIDEKLEESS